MKITALTENTTADERIEAEHGLSLYIETADRRILFDMGQSDLFAKNAGILGIDLAKVDLAVLSHGHYDHGGGLATFLEINQTAPVYVHRDAFLPHYNGTEKYIGLDTSLQTHQRVILTDEEYRISPALSLSACNRRTRVSEASGDGLNEQVGERMIPDDFRHEQYLLIEENGKRVLISGCSHKGILNVVTWFRPDVLIGGFHLSKMPLDQTLSDMARRLGDLPTVYYTCHCTGVEQFNFMKRENQRLHYLSSGQTVQIL